MLIVLATNEEFECASKYFKDYKIIKTGVGNTNVISSLVNENKDQTIINIGYAGSNFLPVGEVVKVARSYNFNLPKNVEIDCKFHGFILDKEGVDCYTSSDFILSCDLKEPVVFDMELNTIIALGFRKVISYKIVSDNLNIEEYESFNEAEVWQELVSKIDKEVNDN